MTTPIRIGVIGTSWWADLGHLPFLTTDERVQVLAICGRNQERGDRQETQWPITSRPSIFRRRIFR